MLPPAGTGVIGSSCGSVVSLTRMFPVDAKAIGTSVNVNAARSSVVMIFAFVFCIFLLSPIFYFSRTLISRIFLFMLSVNKLTKQGTVVYTLPIDVYTYMLKQEPKFRF